MSVILSGITESSTHLSGNPIQVLVTSSGVPAGASAYEVLLKIESVDGELEGAPFTDADTPDANGLVKFDVSALVDQAVSRSIFWPIPDLWEGKYHGYENMIYDVHLTPGEKYIDSSGLLVETFGATLGIFVVKGKMPEYLLAEFNEDETDWSTWFCTGKHFFSLMPRTQSVSPYQPVKLWWKTNQLQEDFTMTTTAYYSDGSTDVHTDSGTAYRPALMEFDMQPAQLGLIIDNGTKRLVKYTCSLGGETFTFNVDWANYEKYYYLFVDNQIGGIECIWLKGRLKYEPEGKRTISVKKRQQGDGIKIPTLRVSGNSRQRKWIINSGYKQAEMPALDILLDTPNAWLALPPETGDTTDIQQYSLIPVIVSNSSLALFDEMNYGMDEADIELIEAHL
jgi:hypothetical protein